MKIIFTPSRKQFAVRCLLRNTLRPVLAFVLSLIVMPLMAQNNLTVKGRITDENNQPISRVTVALKGTGEGLVKTEVDKIGHLKAGTRKRDKDCSSMIVDLIFLKSKAKKNSLQG